MLLLSLPRYWSRPCSASWQPQRPPSALLSLPVSEQLHQAHGKQLSSSHRCCSLQKRVITEIHSCMMPKRQHFIGQVLQGCMSLPMDICQNSNIHHHINICQNSNIHHHINICQNPNIHHHINICQNSNNIHFYKSV